VQTFATKQSFAIYVIPVQPKMSAFVINNPSAGDAKFAGTYNGPDATFKQYSSIKSCGTKKTLIVVGIVFKIVLIVGAVLLYYFLKKDTESSAFSSTPPKFKEMESDMNKNEDPCRDFYKYSCGNYINRYSSLNYKDKFSTLTADNTKKAKKILEGMKNTKDPFFKKAYTYYDACMNNPRSMDAYFSAADEIGGSDITTIGPFDRTKWNLEYALKKLKLQFNTNPLFTIHVGHDLFNTSRNILLIKAPDTALLTKLAGEENELPSTHGISEDVLDYDFDVMSSLVNNFQSRLTSKFATQAVARTRKPYLETYLEVTQAANFDSVLVRDIKALFSGLKIRDIYKVISVGQLSNITGDGIHWPSLLQSLSPKGSSFNINNDTQVGLMVPISYLKKVKTYVSGRNRGGLPNYFIWFLLKKLSPVLPDEYFAQYYFNAPATEMGKEGKERWRACLLETETSMPFSVGMMFAKDVITPLTVKKLSDMLKEIKGAFKIGMKQLSWLDQQTKNAVEDKISSVLDIIAGPHVFTAGWLDNLYKDVTVIGKKYSQMFKATQRNIVQINLKRYFLPGKRDEFDVGGFVPKFYDVNAFYDRTKNLIMVLSGIMRLPFVYESGPSYINFAKVGAVLGHELLHGFDSNGWNYDKSGQISPWTTKHSQDGFTVRANCVKNQYSAYISGSSYINGSRTLAENIADNAGLKYAFLAYRSFSARLKLNETKPAGLKDLSLDQLFFIGYAQMWCRAASTIVKNIVVRTDTHSPNQYRVIGSVSNFKSFADAFKCARGTPMNPIRRCEFW